jgi:type III secretory pathway component EscR
MAIDLFYILKGIYMQKEQMQEEIKKKKEYKDLLKTIKYDIEKYEELLEYAQDECDEEFFENDLKRCKKEYKVVQNKLEKIEEYKRLV